MAIFPRLRRLEAHMDSVIAPPSERPCRLCCDGEHPTDTRSWIYGQPVNMAPVRPCPGCGRKKVMSILIWPVGLSEEEKNMAAPRYPQD